MEKQSSDNPLLGRIEGKYGEASKGGFQGLPDILLKSQSTLGISSLEMVVLINILSFWWYAEKLPFPTAATISKRIGVSSRTIERAIKALTAKELLKREKSEDGKNCIDPCLLVEKLNSLVQTDTDYMVRNQNRGVA